jgi:hypothetical protein
VPTMITEDPWVASALISASIPTLVRIGKKFTATGVTVNTPRGVSKTKDSSMQRYTLKRVVSEEAEKMKMLCDLIGHSIWSALMLPLGKRMVRRERRWAVAAPPSLRSGFSGRLASVSHLKSMIMFIRRIPTVR